jgi:hypothetical protein
MTWDIASELDPPMVEHCRARKINWEHSVRTHCERDALGADVFRLKENSALRPAFFAEVLIGHYIPRS